MQTSLAQKVILITFAGVTGFWLTSFAAETVPRGLVIVNSEGKLEFPTGYRKWPFIGASVTPNDMNGGAALFPEFHSVYIDPESFAEYQKTGAYRDGAVLIKELAGVGAKEATSGKGYFMGEILSLEVAIKDSKSFPREPGYWAYFSFNEQIPHPRPAAKHPAASCNQCHQENAEEDFVFSQDYPVLKAVSPKHK